ncbi:MAG: TonB C-terminal domain-containing protein, partial [Polaromonas sp.]|nr:TonB C-terminal domain-containing protein [Polaromonas sp.]
KGTAAQGSGASSTYGAIVKAAIKPNVVFTEEVTGNPMAKIEVRLTLDGTIISQRLVASSGNKSWDDAAMNGVTRTGVMPRDVDGRIPDSTLILEMRPRN